jgi:hypothetical protein
MESCLVVADISPDPILLKRPEIEEALESISLGMDAVSFKSTGKRPLPLNFCLAEKALSASIIPRMFLPAPSRAVYS